MNPRKGCVVASVAGGEINEEKEVLASLQQVVTLQQLLKLSDFRAFPRDSPHTVQLSFIPAMFGSTSSL